MTQLTRVAIGLLVCAALFGHALDPALVDPPRSPRANDGRALLAVDFHAHTRFSDGFLSPFGVVLAAKRQHLDAIAITEHNNVFPAQLARAFSEVIGGPRVLVGEEITTSRYHLIAVGLETRIASTLPLAEVIRRAHAQRAITIAAHPWRRYWSAYDPVMSELDAAEVVHPSALRQQPGSTSHQEMVEFFERAAASGHPLAAIGSSDFHFFALLGICRTYVLAADTSERAIFDAVRARRTATRAPDGRFFGDPEVIAMARAELSREYVSVYGVRGPLDVVGRFLAVFGLLLLLCCGRFEREQRA